MSTCLQTVNIDEETDTINSDSIACKYNNNNDNKCSLQCKENVINFKHNKALKRKLKKYKLRKDGKEDEDILNVSESLLSTLKIKSPNGKQNINNFSQRGAFVHKNYLTKMARRKQDNKINNMSNNSEIFKSPPKENGIAESLCTETLNELTEGDSVLTNKSEEIKQNAFKLMMDSRNRSIGTNSPGKVKSVDESELQEIIEKRNGKAKRNLLLQKMAEAKGSLKKKEMDECQEGIIKQKMAKRAERLKGMITNNHSKPNNKIEQTNLVTVLPDDSDITNKSSFSEARSLQLMNIFNDSNKSPVKKIKIKKRISKEDKEFLIKLSPSMKKKENMLCYFKKIEKNPKPSQDSRKNSKTKKVSLNRNTHHSSKDDIADAILDKKEAENLQSATVNNNDRKKRKRKDNVEFIGNNMDTIENEKEQVKPKRNAKRPNRYTDETVLSSSDEEFHIFTPKKKKHIKDGCNSKNNMLPSNQVNNITLISKEIKLLQPNKKKSKKDVQKEPTNLAPIFMRKQQLDPAAIEAKQKFFQSNIPSQLQKNMIQQKDKTVLINFPIVVHIQQNETTDLSKSIQQFITSDSDTDEDICVNNSEGIFKSLLNQNTNRNKHIQIVLPKKNTPKMLQNIKQLYPEFPVYRTYRLLKAKRDFKDCTNKDILKTNINDGINVVTNNITDIRNEDRDNLSWADKYKAVAANEIIGNFESIKEMKKWLITWTENKLKSKKNPNSDSDFSDFCHSDTDNSDYSKRTNNFLILTGPTGSGKTSSVYAVASELAIKVIEVNASSKRTGKIMLQDLHEATQSHKVNRAVGSSTGNSQKSQEMVNCDVPRNIKKRGRPKKKEKSLVKLSGSGKKEKLSLPSRQESVRTGASLILIDDADIVFDQDDGFCSAVAQLIHCSKRPVILVTASLACTHLQNFIKSGTILNMSRLLPRMLGTWLDIMCLADNGMCWPGVGAEFLNFYKGDVRKTINNLQFYILSCWQQTTLAQKDVTKINDDSIVDDECLSMSWTDQETEKNVTNSNAEDIFKYFMGEQTQLLNAAYHSKLFNTWWSLPKILYGSSAKTKCDYSDKQNHLFALETIANAVDNISISDYFSNIMPHATSNFTSKPWYCSESDSVSENTNLHSYNRNVEVIDDISDTIVMMSIITAQKTMKMESNINISIPDMMLQRKYDKMLSRHHNLTSHLNPSAALDRRALALDYWSCCRTICRIEKSKTDGDAKKRNRFYHYLKSVKVIFKNDSFDILCDSLCCNGIKE